MSTASQESESNSDTFEQEIVQDPDICYNCYRRWRDTMERNYAVEKDGYVRPIRDSLDDVVKPIRLGIQEMSDNFHARETQGQYPVCKCGTPFQSFRPVDLDVAKRYARRICRHLERKGIDFDEDEFFAQMIEQKREPDNQYKIDEIFRTALKRSQ